jgi:hypothetical protein
MQVMLACRVLVKFDSRKPTTSVWKSELNRGIKAVENRLVVRCYRFYRGAETLEVCVQIANSSVIQEPRICYCEAGIIAGNLVRVNQLAVAKAEKKTFA